MRRSPTLQARGQHIAKDFQFCMGNRQIDERVFALNALRARSDKCSGTCSRGLRKIEGADYGYRLREQSAAGHRKAGEAGQYFHENR